MAAVEGISSLRRRKRSTEASSPAPGDAYSVEPEHGANTSVGVRKDGEGSRGDAPLRGIPGGSVRSSGTDYALALCLFAVAVVVRFYKLSDVQSAVFDEVHYGKFANWVLSGEYFFDVNPPFGKWIIALMASALGFNPTLDHFEHPGAPISSPGQAFAARAPAALFGSLTVPIFYRLCRQLRLSQVSSFVGASFILFDSMHVIQSRMIMVDSLLVFFTCVSLLSALLMWDAKQVCLLKGTKKTIRDVVYVSALLVGTGIFCGLAVSVRWTAFATPAVVLIVSTFGIPPFCLSPLSWVEVSVLFSSMLLSYFGSFDVFLLTVSKSGTGDAFMSKDFQLCLHGSKEFLDAEAAGLSTECRMSAWAKFVELNQKIFQYSKGIRGADKWGSSWFQWVVNWRGVLYHRQSVRVGGTDEAPVNNDALVYTLMNPAMVLCIDILMVMFVCALFYSLRHRKKNPIQDAVARQMQRGCVLLFGWMGSMLPTMVVYRSGPIYQYLPGLFFAQALSALCFDLLFPRGGIQKACAGLLSVMLLAAFIFWSPWVYARELAAHAHSMRRWLPGWD